tara:strand:- start:1375 stop:1728 length:354 start_codon:yes stop_codon:yes gene_type:complete
MATLTPTLTLTSTDISADRLSFTVTDSLNVTKDVISPSKVQLSTSDLTLFATTYGKSYVYFRNVDDTIAINIEVTDGNSTIQLAAGEFAFFPWTGASAVIVNSASGTPYLEYALFEA